MSIAVSVVVRASARLRVLLACAGVLHCAVALALVGGVLGPLRHPMLGGALCALAGVGAARAALQAIKTLQIDISGSGQIRLTVQPIMASPQSDAQTGALVRLLPGGVLWPQLMLLRLGDDGAAVAAMAIFPGAVSPEAFRAVSVACRIIGGRRADVENLKID